MELNRKQIKSQARILVQNKWGSLFVITFVVMMLTGMGMFNNSQIDLVKQISHYNHTSDYGSWDDSEDNPVGGSSMWVPVPPEGWACWMPANARRLLAPARSRWWAPLPR